MFAKIQPVNVFPRGQAAVLEVMAIVTPNKGANVEWRLSSEAMQPMTQGMEAMPKDAYDLWAADDSYLFQWVASQLGLTITELVEPVAPAAAVDAPAAEEPS